MRKTKLVDCNPRWGEHQDHVCYVTFDCPEGHEDCLHSIPFTPALDGTDVQHGGSARWIRTGETFEVLSLSPSIKRNPRYGSAADAIADGRIPEYVTPSMLCAMHVMLTNGEFTFADDSR